MRRTLLVLLLLAFYARAGLWRAWTAVHASSSGRDYATYHYAVQEALDGGDPYDTRALSRRARAEGTRRSVHPYFYPPPFLLGMLWAAPLDLVTGYRAFFWLNQGVLLAVLLALRRWFRPGVVLLAFLLATFTPIPDNAKMGQANLPVLLLLVLGLWLGRGSLVGAAAMAKMSPAIFLPWWGARRRWRPVAGAVAAAVVLSLAALPLVGPDVQWRFYTAILPGFSRGDYHGLTVPITLPANHSIPDLFNQLWPGPDRHSLDPLARRAGLATTLGLLAAILLVGRHRRDPLGDANVAGALAVLMVITPVYAYEHHLVMLLLPLAAVGAAFERGRLGPAWLALAAPAYFFLAWPLSWLRAAQRAAPALAWFLQESKFFGALALLLLALVAAARSPRRAA